MTSILYSLSILGIGQSLFLAVYFYLKRKIDRTYLLLASLCLLVSTIMLAIVLPNAELMDSFKFYEFFEYIFTLSFGPFLYFFCLSFLGESKFGNPINYLVHFLPVVSYSFIIFLGFINHGVIVEIPIWVPLLHLQSYTIWLVIRVYNSKKNQESVNERTINLL